MDLHQAESNENQSDGKNSIEDEDDVTSNIKSPTPIR